MVIGPVKPRPAPIAMTKMSSLRGGGGDHRPGHGERLESGEQSVAERHRDHAGVDQIGGIILRTDNSDGEIDPDAEQGGGGGDDASGEIGARSGTRDATS